jgi:hypothetical protein
MNLWSWESLIGFRHTIAAIAGLHTTAVLNMLVGIMALLGLRLLLRKTWIAVILTSGLFFIMVGPAQGDIRPFIVSFLVLAAIHWFVLFRFGLLPILVGATISDLLQNLPLTFDLTAWYADVTLLTLALVLGLAVWGFWISLAGRPLFRDQILEAEGAR